MDHATQTFTQLRPRLLGIGYRMLGSLAEAEDMVQDIWMRWAEASRHHIDNAEAWLVATATRDAIDRLRSARTARERYVGMWLPEPILSDAPATPEELRESWDNLSIAFLAILEHLAPEARAAFLLREVFDIDYAQIAAILGKTQPACRQIVHRANAQLQEARPRCTVPDETHRRLMGRFADAVTRADLPAMTALLHDTAVLRGDGGGLVVSMPKPTVGGERIACALYAPNLRYRDELRVELAPINGRLGLLRYFRGELESAQSYETDHERIVRVFVQRNPQKLRSIATRRKPALD